MNLTNQINIRQLNYKPKVDSQDGKLVISDLGVSINLSSKFRFSPENSFQSFLDNYMFPDNEELNKKDKETYKKVIFPPLKILESCDKTEEGFRPIVLIYLYDREALTGTSQLHIWSINKFEMMWAPYFIDSSGPYRTNPKVLKIDGIPSSLSQALNFNYKSKNHPDGISSYLRTLTIDLQNYILAFYIVDNVQNRINDADLQGLIKGIKIEEAEPNTI